MSKRAGKVVRIAVIPRKIIIKRFKSIEELTLDLVPGVNVLVGPNASGKSNILEAIAFFRKALVDEISRIPYNPIREYWSAEDIFYMRDMSEPIVIGVDGEIVYENLPSKGKQAVIEVGITAHFDAIRHTVMPVRIEAKIGNATRMVIEPGQVTLIINKRESEKYPIIKKNLARVLKHGVLREDNEKYVATISAHLEPPLSLKDLISLLGEMPLIFYDAECRQYRRTVLACAYTPLIAPISELASENLPEEERETITIPVIAEILPNKRRQKIPTKHVMEPIPLPDLEDLLHPRTIIYILNEKFIKNIIMIKHPDTGRVREPTPLSAVGEALDARAAKLPAVLFAIREERGSIPEIIEDSVRRFFPNTTLSLLTQYGRVALVAYEDGMRLTPRNLSDGLIKLVALMTAASLNPALLLIDEIENSMHYEMQEYVIHTLDALGIPTIVATHSPFVVDLVGPERTIILSKEPGGATRAERVRDAKRLKKRLTELGISFSDYVFYERTRVRRG